MQSVIQERLSNLKWSVQRSLTNTSSTMIRGYYVIATKDAGDNPVTYFAIKTGPQATDIERHSDLTETQLIEILNLESNK